MQETYLLEKMQLRSRTIQNKRRHFRPFAFRPPLIRRPPLPCGTQPLSSQNDLPSRSRGWRRSPRPRYSAACGH